MSSRLITYADNGIRALLGSDEAVEAREGACREFAEITSRLLSGVGLIGGLIAGNVYDAQGNLRGGHAWNYVWLDSTGTQYWIEPQDDPLAGYPVFFNPEAPICIADCQQACTQDSDCCGVANGSTCQGGSPDGTSLAICVPATGACN